MADLTELQSSGSTKIAGANPSTGAEDNFLDVDSSGRITDKITDSSGNALNAYNGQLGTADLANGSGTQAALTVGTSAVLVNVSGTNLTNRKSLTLYNNGTVPIYWGLTSGVTTSTGTPIPVGFQAMWSVGSTTSIYAISGTASQNTRVTECA